MSCDYKNDYLHKKQFLRNTDFLLRLIYNKLENHDFQASIEQGSDRFSSVFEPSTGKLFDTEYFYQNNVFRKKVETATLKHRKTSRA